MKTKKTLYDLIRTDKVKERIVKEYSQKFYNKVVHYVQVVSPITYEQGKYYGEGWEAHLYGNIAKFTYFPMNDELTINLSLDGRVVQSNGEVYYNTEGWHIGIDEYKNDFDEVVKKEAAAIYKVDGAEYSYSKYKLAVVIRTYAITLWTNELGESYKIKNIRIKDHKSGDIYNIDYDEPYLLENRVMNDNIGVFMYGKNMAKFINIVSSLNDYTISIKGYYEEYEKNIIITNPANFTNIKDVYMELINMQENLNDLN